MSASGPYSRLYHSLVDDPDFAGVYEDDAAFATWTRLLMLGDASYPTLPPLPRWVKRRALAKLVDRGLVEVLPGQRFRLKGLEAERGRRASLARTAALRRHHPSNADAMQTQSERSASAMPRRDETRKDEQGANAPTKPNGAGGVFLGMRPKPVADPEDVRRQHEASFQLCADCGIRRGVHRDEHPFVDSRTVPA